MDAIAAGYAQDRAYEVVAAHVGRGGGLLSRGWSLWSVGATQRRLCLSWDGFVGGNGRQCIADISRRHFLTPRDFRRIRRAQAGEVIPDDKQLSMDWFVEGVVGKVQ